jgi:peptide/nickel transport system permease protein
MLNYIIRRLLIIPILMIGVTLLIFSIISLMNPLDRAEALFPRQSENRKSVRNYEGLVEKYGLDDPMYLQYWHWIVGREDPDTGELQGGVIYGNLGWSQIGRMGVFDVISSRAPATLELILWSAIPMTVLSIWLGVKAAVNHNRPTDHFLRVSAITGWSIPNFVFGFFLIMIFTVELGWFSPGRISLEGGGIIQSDEFIKYTNMYTVDALLNGQFDIFLDALEHLVLPVLTLAVANWAFLFRVTRFSMLEVLNQDYITTARSKGLPEEWVVRRHAFPNALTSIITVGGLTVVGFFNNAVITEVVFNFPGLGAFLAKAAISLDLVSVSGVTLFTSFILIMTNLLVDILYGVVDPRVRLD